MRQTSHARRVKYGKITTEDESVLNTFYQGAFRMSLRQAITLGAVSGLRSMAGLATLVDHASRVPYANGNASLPDVLRARNTARLLRVLQIGEMVTDKLPFTPNRVDPLPLMGRAMFGGLVGALAYKQDRLAGGLAGASMAVIGAYMGYRVRKQLGTENHIPDPILAIIEDAITVTLAESAVSEG